MAPPATSSRLPLSIATSSPLRSPDFLAVPARHLEITISKLQGCGEAWFYQVEPVRAVAWVLMERIRPSRPSRTCLGQFATQCSGAALRPPLNHRVSKPFVRLFKGLAVLFKGSRGFIFRVTKLHFARVHRTRTNPLFHKASTPIISTSQRLLLALRRTLGLLGAFLVLASLGAAVTGSTQQRQPPWRHRLL